MGKDKDRFPYCNYKENLSNVNVDEGGTDIDVDTGAVSTSILSPINFIAVNSPVSISPVITSLLLKEDTENNKLLPKVLGLFVLIVKEAS